MKTITFISLLTIVIFLISCKTENESRNEDTERETDHAEEIVILNKRQIEALNLELGNIQMRNISTVIKTNGQLEVPPSNSADVTAVIGGNIKDILVFHGDKVRKGQMLAILEHPDYITLQEEFAETANNLEFMENEFQRQKELFENNVGAGKDFQRIKSEYNTARSRYEGLKSRLILLNIDPSSVQEGKISTSIRILSPITGYVNDITGKVGTYAGPSDKLFSITDNSAIHADFLVYEKDVHLLKKGQKINMTVANQPGEELTATIFAIGNEFEPELRAVHIHASLDRNPGNLIPGMYVSGHIHTNNNFTSTLPDDAIVDEGTKSFIFVKTDNNEDEAHGNEVHEDEENSVSFKMLEVIKGNSDEGYTEITPVDSLPQNAEIVLNAAYYLLADMKKGETEHEH